MRPLPTIAASLLLGCNPLSPPAEATTSSSSESGDAIEVTSSPTTINSTTTTLDPTTSAPTTSGEIPFVVKPDGLVDNIECDIFTQDCAPGQKCAPYVYDGGGQWNATKCVEITGDGGQGDPCTAPDGGGTGIDDCALGAFCWNVDETNHGVCVTLCAHTNTPECPPGSFCSITQDISLCISVCDPLLQDCPADDLCIPTSVNFSCVVDGSGQMGAANDPCEFANACDQGLLCLNTASASAACQQGSQGCCQPFCKFPGSPCPNPDQQCLQWFDPMQPIPPGSEDIGVCAIPE